MKNFFIVLISAIIFVPTGAYFALEYSDLKAPSSEVENLETQESTEEIKEDAPQQIVEGYNLDIANKVILGGTEPIPINEEFVTFLDEKKAVITNFTLPHTLDDLSQVYIAATFLDEENEDSYFTTEIYRYSLDNGEYNKVFEYFSSNEDAPTQLRPIAIDGENLVVQKEKVDNQPGECATVWTVGDLMEFSLTDNDRTLVNYQTPDYIETRNQAVIDRCEFANSL